MSLSVPQLVATIIKSGLLSAEEIQLAIPAGSSDELSLTEDFLLGRLQQRGLLTRYQAAAVQMRKFEELIFGNYVVLDRIGAGGMGTVFRARHRRMKRTVAIKVLRRENMTAPEQVARFQREVETIAQLSHPNIVTAYDADECVLGHFLVMEYVAGADLAELVKRQGPLSIRTAVDFTLQTARALQYAHEQGIIHRDVKPANLLRSAGGTIKVTDLGLAGLSRSPGFAAARANEPQVGMFVGTVDYMSPEQAFETQVADHRADIYSLACTLFYLLTGQVTYSGETVMAKLLAHLRQPVRSLCAIRPDIPQALDAVFQHMAAKSPADRFPSMAAVIDALEDCPVPEGEEPAALVGLSGTEVAESAPTSWLSGNSLTLADLSVLLVEPSRVQSRVIGDQLRSLGVRRLQTASAGQAALELMRATRPELVISAMHLPDMTGATLVQAMRADRELSDMAFVLVSSETDNQFLEPVRQSGAAAILRKPFDLAALKRALLVAVDFFSPHALRVHNLHAAALRVLIVDDSRSARRHIQRVLEKLGIRTLVEAADGREAIELLGRQEFDLIVTDFHMPGINGPALIRHIRADRNHGQIPVLMITSGSDPRELAEAHEAGVSALCGKVFDPQAVCGILEKILARSR